MMPTEPSTNTEPEPTEPLLDTMPLDAVSPADLAEAEGLTVRSIRRNITAWHVPRFPDNDGTHYVSEAEYLEAKRKHSPVTIEELDQALARIDRLERGIRWLHTFTKEQLDIVFLNLEELLPGGEEFPSDSDEPDAVSEPTSAPS